MVHKQVIKSQITNQIKRMFPRIEHTDTHYLGIGFREDVVKEVVGEIRQTVGRNYRSVNGVDRQLSQAEVSCLTIGEEEWN